MLLEAFDADKAERYDLWRRVRLKKDIVRKVFICLQLLFGVNSY